MACKEAQGIDMLPCMTMEEYFIVFPEGDTQEIPGRLDIGQLVDINGAPLRLPLGTHRVIAYRVWRINAKENRGGTEVFHQLELMGAQELLPYVR